MRLGALSFKLDKNHAIFVVGARVIISFLHHLSFSFFVLFLFFICSLLSYLFISLVIGPREQMI